MLRVRCRATHCARDFTRRKFWGTTAVAVRELTDSAQQAPTPTPTAWIQQTAATPTTGAAAAAAAAAATPAAATAPAAILAEPAAKAVGLAHAPAAGRKSTKHPAGEGAVPQHRSGNPQRDDTGGELSEGDDHDPCTPREEDVVSRLKSIRTSKGPGHLAQAMEILNKARSEGVRDITAYNVVIRMIGMEPWVNAEKTHMLEDLLVKLKGDALAPNMYTYNGILFVYAQARSLRKVERAYKEMLSKGIEPNVLTLSHLAMAQAWNSSDDMYRTLAEMEEKGWTPTRGAHLSVIASMWQRKDAKGVLQMMKRMLEKRFQPTEATFAVALMSAGRLGNASFARVLFGWRHSSGFGPKHEIFSSMMLAHSKADLHEESLVYWRQLVCLDGVGQVEIDLSTCQVALKSAVATSRWDEVGTIAEMLEGRGAAATDHTYKLAIAACRKRSGTSSPDYSDRVERTLQALRQAGMPPTPEVMCRVAIAYVYGKEWEKAAAIFEQTLTQNVEMWAFRWEGVIQTYFQLERFSDVKKIWMRSKTKKGDLHTVRGNEVAMMAAHRLLDGDWAKEIMTVPANGDSKKGLNPATLMIAIKVLVETERTEEAREILKEWRPSTTTRVNYCNFNELLLLCQEHAGTDVGLDIFEVLRKHDSLSRLQPRTFSFVVGAFCEHGRAGELLTFFEEQLAAGYEPGVDCYKIMARGTLEAGDSQASAKFLETARNLPAAAGAAAAAPAPAAAIEEETAMSAEAVCGSAAGDGGRGGVGADGGGGEDASVQQQQQQEEEERRAPEATEAGGEGDPPAAAAVAESR